MATYAYYNLFLAPPGHTYFTGSILRTNPTVQYTSHNSDIAHAEGGRGKVAVTVPQGRDSGCKMGTDLLGRG